MSKTLLDYLSSYAGSFEGQGVNHEHQPFTGRLELKPMIQGKGFELNFSAQGSDGTLFHEERTWLAFGPDEKLSLWSINSNNPAVLKHELIRETQDGGSDKTLVFGYGNHDDRRGFREEIAIDFFSDGDLAYRYSWGLPGGEFQARSSVRMHHGKKRLVREASLKTTEQGLVPEGEGWYVINAKEAAWTRNERFGEACTFEGDHRFTQYGVNIHVIAPDSPSCHYHGEDDQEDFLVLSGQCRLIIEGEERLLKKWDFVHCPKWAKHVFIGAGPEPCAILMMGGRTGHGVIYPVMELVSKYGACPEREVESPKESYSRCPSWEPSKPNLFLATLNS